RSTSRFAHVIAGDRNRVPLRHVFVRPREHVGDDSHRLRRRVDVGAACDVFLQNVVLHGSRQLTGISALAFGHGTFNANRIEAVALIVIEVEIFVRSIPWKSRSISSMESMATPTLPTSPNDMG